MDKVLIIAEAGVNHNGDINLAKELIYEAKKSGADIVKFQTAVPEMVISMYAKKAAYQKAATGDQESQLEMCKKLHLPLEAYHELSDICREMEIQFLSTPFDIKSIEFLDGLKMPIWKIPSGEVTNLPYLVRIGKTHKPVIMSTGMCTLEEINEAINILTDSGTEQHKITLLHCTTEYPTPYSDVNLKAMDTLRDTFHLDIGYSDHTEGIVIPIAAVARGAKIIEKHFTLDKNMNGPDHKASLTPKELFELVKAIRNVEKSMGTGEKVPAQSEIKNINIARKSIIANKKIYAGEIFTEENITTKRPGNGISPMKWYEVLGKAAQRDFEEDELIEL